jgi:hypothetical protein
MKINQRIIIMEIMTLIKITKIFKMISTNLNQAINQMNIASRIFKSKGEMKKIKNRVNLLTKNRILNKIKMLLILIKRNRSNIL